MAKVPVPVKSVLNDPELSLTSSPFSPGNMIIKNASFKSGETPDHLEQFAISEGTCKGENGTVIYEGKEVPATAACVGRQRS